MPNHAALCYALQAGPPPAAKFQIAGLDTCQPSPDCGGSARQLHRLRARQYRSFYRYLPAV